jgi:hypothetical protein
VQYSDVNRYELCGAVVKFSPLCHGEGKEPTVQLRVETRNTDGSTTQHLVVLYGSHAVDAHFGCYEGDTIAVDGELKYHVWTEKGAEKSVPFLAARRFDVLAAGPKHPAVTLVAQEADIPTAS